MLLIKIFGGFTQNAGHWCGGQELREILLSSLDDYSSLSVRVDFHPWNDNFKHVARQTYLLRAHYPNEQFGILNFSYSYGAGCGTKRYLKYLRPFGLGVDVAVFADGIYHSALHVRWWHALFGSHPIRFGDNLKSYYGFYQEEARPMGCRPITASTTKCLGWQQLHLPHVEMDDSPEWKKKCVEVAVEQAKKFIRHKNLGPKGCPSSPAQERRLSFVDIR